MQSFRTIDLSAFQSRANAIAFPSVLGREVKRLDQGMIFRDAGPGGCMVHDGNLVALKDFQPPACHVLIDGDLFVNGILDCASSGGDDGGSLFVTGNVICNAFFNEYEKAVVIGGDLTVRDILLNCFSDSLLYIGGSLKTRFFLGYDMWAEVGRTAEMEYGLGYCLPLGYIDAASQAIRPRNDKDASSRVLAIDDVNSLDTLEIVHHVRSGRPLFRW